MTGTLPCLYPHPKPLDDRSSQARWVKKYVVAMNCPPGHQLPGDDEVSPLGTGFGKLALKRIKS